MSEAIVRDTTFATVGTQNRAGLGQEGLPWGTGTTISYIVSSDTIRVALTDGRTFDFDNPGEALRPFASTVVIYGTEPETIATTNLLLSTLLVDGVPLTYTRLGSFWISRSFDASSGIIMGSQFLFGSRTTDMPKTGSAAYSVMPGAGISVGGTQAYQLTTASTATLTADFSAGRVSTGLHLIGTPNAGGPERDFGVIAGSGPISQAAFQGTWQGAGGGFWGAFFGPGAREAGYTFTVTKDDFTSNGIVVGRKN